MATRNHTRTGLLYGISDALSQIAPLPIVANRAPQTNDIAEIGTLWIYPATSAPYILVSVVNNAATWLLLESGGGAGVFSSLLVTPGPSTLNGTVSLSTDASTATILVGTGAAAKTVTVGSTNSTSATTIQSASGGITINSHGGALTAISGVGALNISNDAAATTVNVGTGSATKTVTLGSASSTSATTVQSGSGALNITSANGAITVDSGTGTIEISGDSTNTTVQVGHGGGAKLVTIGSLTASSTLTLDTPVGTTVSVPQGITITTAGSGVVLPAGLKIVTGAGDPNGVVTAPLGSLYLNTTGSGVNDRAWLNTNSGTTWTFVVTGA